MGALSEWPFSFGSGGLADYASPLLAVAAMGAAFLVAGFAIVSLARVFHEPTTSPSRDVPAPK